MSQTIIIITYFPQHLMYLRQPREVKLDLRSVCANGPKEEMKNFYVRPHLYPFFALQIKRATA